MSYQIISPYPNFLDSNGNALDFGKLYLGVADDNPVSNPIQIYWDEDYLYPAAQPIIILGGLPSRSGSPGALYCATEYSLSLYDQAGRLIYYCPNGAKFLPGDQVDTAITDGLAATIASLNSRVDAVEDSMFRKNFLINGDFMINQRAAYGGGSTVGYVLDRWGHWNVGYTATTSKQTFTLGQTDVPGNPRNYGRVNITVAGSAVDDVLPIAQWIEDVSYLADREVTLSFWAKADTTRDITVCWSQGFGSGGSPSADVHFGQNRITLSTAWQQFTQTLTIPSIAGKTIGSDGYQTSGTLVLFFLGAGSDYDSRSLSLGHQTGVFDFADVQVEESPVATDFERLTEFQQLTRCQRYFQGMGAVGLIAYGQTGLDISSTYTIPVDMRVSPSASYMFSAFINISALTFDFVETKSFRANGTVITDGNASFYAYVALEAEY